MDAVEQLYHLQLEGQRRAEQLQRETTAGFDYLRKRAELSGRRVQQASTGQAQPPSARSTTRSWDASTRDCGVASPVREVKAQEFPKWLPASLRNILIRNQQMELRWQRDFAERLRHAAPSTAWGGTQQDASRQRQFAEQQKAAEQQRIEARRRQIAELQAAEQQQRQQRVAERHTGVRQPAAQSTRSKGRGWDDSTRRIGHVRDDG